MTDEISFPPLHDLSAGEFELRKQHVLSEITRDPDRARPLRTILALPRLRLRVALPAVAAICAAAVAMVFVGVNSGGRSTKPPIGTRDRMLAPMVLNFTRSGQTVDSIAVTVQSPIAGATLELQVLRSDAAQLPEADTSSSQVVFQEQVPMIDTTAPAADGPLSTWSGTLAPTDWQGGCQNAFYTVKTIVVPAGTSYDNPIHDIGQAGWFTCNPTS